LLTNKVVYIIVIIYFRRTGVHGQTR